MENTKRPPSTQGQKAGAWKRVFLKRAERESTRAGHLLRGWGGASGNQKELPGRHRPSGRYLAVSGSSSLRVPPYLMLNVVVKGMQKVSRGGRNFTRSAV